MGRDNRQDGLEGTDPQTQRGEGPRVRKRWLRVVIVGGVLLALVLLLGAVAWWTHGGANEWTVRRELDAGGRSFHTDSDWRTGDVTVFISESDLDADPMESDEFTRLLTQLNAISQEHGFEIDLVLHPDDSPVG